MEKKPNVFPTQEQRKMAAASAEKAKVEAYEREKAIVTNEVYTNSQVPQDTPQGHYDAVEFMKQRTANELQMYKEHGKVVYPELAEKTENGHAYVSQQDYNKNEEQMRLRDEALAKNRQQIDAYQKLANEAAERRNHQYVTNGVPGQNPQANQQNPMNNYQDMSGYHNTPPTTPPPVKPPVKPPVNNYGSNFGPNPSNINPYMLELSQPNYNCPFDVIPLPSGGKTYRNKKANIRVGYMTTSDENILTSPNLIQSGEFLEILMNRKILEPELRYRDLLVGDRNAIMIWLRATGYGEMYPITVMDENGEPFDTDINLHDLKMKKLEVDPDEEGLFTFHFPLCKATIKFRLLTCGDIDDIEKMVEADEKNGNPINNSNTYTFERMIVEVNGHRDRNIIRDFANSIRIKDAKEFSDYLDKLECGIDLNLTLRTPGGGSVESFLPLNVQFFWPNLRV